MRKMGPIQTMHEIGELRERVRVLEKMRDKTLSDTRAQVKREIELENIARKIINFLLEQSSEEFIIYPSIPFSITVKNIDTDLEEDENYHLLIRLKEYIDRQFKKEGIVPLMVLDKNSINKWVYLNILVNTSLEDNCTLMKYFIKIGQNREQFSIHNEKAYTKNVYETLILK